MALHPRFVDRGVVAVCAGLVAVLGFTALRGVPEPAAPPQGFDAWLAPHTETVILVWCALTVLYAPGFLGPRRWPHQLGLLVNTLYLAISVPGVHLFAMIMHSLLVVYSGWRLLGPPNGSESG